MDPSRIRIDPAIRSLIPPLSKDERRQLEANLAADGCRDPLVCWVDVLLDGHNRLEICRAKGLPFKVVTMDLPDARAAHAWVIRNQVGRRNLSESQRAMLADKLATLSQGQKKADTQICVSQSEAASLFSVGERSVQHARQVQEKGVPELVMAVEQDRVAVSTAAEIASLPEDEQREVLKQEGKGIVAKAKAVKAKRKAKKKAAKAAAKAKPPADLPAASDRYRLIHADLASVNGEVPNGSADWVICDPPYPKDYVALYDALGAFAARALKAGGSLLAMVGQSYLPDILTALSKHLRYHWTVAYLTPGGQSVQLWDRKVNTFWKPVLWLVKGEYAGDWIGDVARSAVNDNDKEHHPWGQSESGMADLIERFTYPGQTIIDPCMGGGTTGVVAVAKGRKFVGIDHDSEAVETAKCRMAAVAAAVTQ